MQSLPTTSSVLTIGAGSIGSLFGCLGSGAILGLAGVPSGVATVPLAVAGSVAGGTIGAALAAISSAQVQNNVPQVANLPM